MAKPTTQAKPAGKRNQRACQLCHVTKVRCIAVPGSPCQNCYQRGVECITNKNNRQRQRVQIKTAGIPPTPTRTGSITQWSPKTVDESVGNSSILNAVPQMHGWNDGFTFQMSPNEAEWRDPSLSPTPPQMPFFDPNQLLNQREDEVWNTFTNLGSPDSTASETSNSGGILPGFIQPLPMMMNPTSIEFLYVNGVFTLPTIQLQNALLQAFVECVLPNMPMIDWPAFIKAICNRDTDHGSVSLLLFYAMMTAATTFVDIGHLQEAGYSYRQEAQEAFYQKAKLLYQAEYESNTMTIVQSILFMTYRLETADGEDSHYWCSIAISTAQNIGLFRDIAGVKNIRLDSKFWKRLAWTCYMTDSQIALRLRCRPLIQGSVFCHQMLTEDDFDIYNLSPESLIQSLGYPLSHNVNVQRDLAMMCIANAQLCVSINEVLEIQSKGRNHQNQSQSSYSPTNEATDHHTRVAACEAKLATWASTFPSSAQTYTFEIDAMEDEPTVSLQRNLLHMQFFTTLAVFYQSQPLPSSKFCVPYAAQQIIRNASELYQKGLHRRLPIVGVTAILVALIIHISEMKKEPTQDRLQAIQSFQSGLEVMADLRDVYREADEITNSAVKIMDSIPLAGGMHYPGVPGPGMPIMSLPQVM